MQKLHSKKTKVYYRNQYIYDKRKAFNYKKIKFGNLNLLDAAPLVNILIGKNHGIALEKSDGYLLKDENNRDILYEILAGLRNRFCHGKSLTSIVTQLYRNKKIKSLVNAAAKICYGTEKNLWKEMEENITFYGYNGYTANDEGVA